MVKNIRETDMKILRSIGLGKSEAIVYLDLVKNSVSSASDIARRVNFHRPNVYDSLKKLKGKGLITEIIEGSGRLFKALEPDRLRIYFKQKESEINKLIFELGRIPKGTEEKETLSLSEGIVSIKNAMIDALNLDSPFYILGVHPDLAELFFDKFLEEFNRDRISRKIELKMLFSVESLEEMKQLNKIPYTESRHLNYGTSSHLSTIIVGDIVYYVSYRDGRLILIKIKHKDIAREQKAHFNNAWKQAKRI